MKNKKLIRPLSLLFLFFLFPLGVFAQTITVKGVVKDVNGETLIGVSVMEVGTSNGAITDASGMYEVKTSANSSLSFSYLGYEKQVVSVNGKTVINVTLKDQDKSLDEVVVVGYGTQRKEAVTGSVASVKGDVIREVPASNITQALQGRVAGVQMAQTSTKPGATMQIRIRGTRSITADNNPLIVLDGIPFAGTIADISTDDIKSIDILKDASATAIYGSRGANGVILITTNSGTKGQKTQVDYNGYYGVKTAIEYPMMNGPEYAKLRILAKKNGPGTDEPYITNADGSITYTANTNWQDLFFRTGIVTSHDLSVSGGNEKGSYKFGAGYYNDQSVVPGSDYTRYSIRSSLDHEIGKYVRIGFTTNSNFNITNGQDLSMYGILSMSPVATPYNTDGTLKRTVKMPQDEQWVYTRSTMANLGDSWQDQTKAFGSYNSAYAEVKIPGIDGLKYRVNLGANFRMSNTQNYTGVGVFSYNPTNNNTATVGNSLTTNWAVENLLTYDKVFAGKHRVNAVAMYSAEQTSYYSSSIQRYNIAGDSFQSYNLAQSSTSNSNDININPSYQGYQISGLESYMGRVMYSYDDRYMISATVRSDASSRLAPGHQWHTYPAVSIGWNIMKESFMKDITAIDALKLRAGYGETSNQSVTPYSTLGLLSTRPYNFGATTATGYFVYQLPNPNLGWEYSQTKNLGLDFSLLKNRLSGTVEYYITDTRNLLYGVNLPVTSGVNTITSNVGATQNKGWEFSLNGVILDNVNGWTWDAGVNVYSNKNKIVALSSGRTVDTDNWLFVGHSLNVIYDYKKVGIWQTTDKYLSILEPGTASAPGMIKVLYTGTYNADGSPTRAISPADRQIIDCDPNFQGGFNTRVGYKGFDLTVVGTFQGGGILNSTLYGSAGYLNINDGRRGQIQVNYWTPTNTSGTYPLPGGVTDSNNPKYGSTLGYFDASYLKVKTITLGYSFNKKWLKNAGIDKLRLYGTIEAPFVLFSPYYKQSGMDPETNSYANDGSNSAVPYVSGLSRLLTVGYNTPETHNFIMGINITF
ncbi:MAG: TonB-dependent receptor [Paludibacter sp.]|nr:TonB-dependent receptor [Paludibacter sp.]